MDHIFSTLIEYFSYTPKEFTYLGIGTVPYGPLTPQTDQLLPVFVVDKMKTKTTRIIHFDPFFESKMDVIHEYFASRDIGLQYDTTNGFHRWANSRTEIIVLPIAFNHSTVFHEGEADSFLELLSIQVLAQKGMLVVQEFTGTSTSSIFRKLYEASLEKDEFKRRILFDITYGADEGCMTDLTKHTPLYTRDGFFYNFLLYSDNEMMSCIGARGTINEVIAKHFTRKYRSDLNRIHVDYRRSLKGDPPLSDTKEYSANTPPPYIMDILQKKLLESIQIFRRLGLITGEKEEIITTAFLNYEDYDVYKWYDLVYKLI